ncbi:hypothetical protein E4631_15625 [Hymenobacter sp. UV11]|uniref:hypothetical protein n=1 Tax=Hymenobacter sp. UV11 TaxID=1849735 RepID=UPI00105EF566|nr:hypothetical protein [Hymenobacter sp. UV11]TFZ65647.1 hypothetical protein E4631_15625 [Hymenobacter sp. UV11]
MQYNSASAPTAQKQCTSELTNEKPLVFTSQMQRLICLVTLCLSSITYSFAQDNTDCNAILSHGIYNYDEIKSNSQYQRDYLDYLYEANFQSSSQATSAGIDLSVPIPGTDIILGGSGNFDSKKYQEWRHTYSTTQIQHVKYDQAYARVRSYTSLPLIQAWTTCTMKNEIGPVIGLYPVDDKKVELRAKFVGQAGVDDARLTAALEITGGTLATALTANSLRKNALLNSAIKSVTLNRKPGQTLKVTLHTNRGDKSLTYPAPPVGVIVRFVASPTQLYTGDVANLSWETNALSDIKLDNEAVNAIDSRTIKPTQSTTYTLTGKTASGTVTKQKVTVSVVPRPRTIVSGEVIIEVPIWADGKNDDTNMSFEVKTQSELLIADGSKWGPGEKLELKPNSTGNIVMKMRTADIPTLTIDNLSRIHFYVHKNPNGNDGMTFATHGRFFLSDGTVATFGTTYLRLQSNDPQSWDDLLDVTIPAPVPQPVAVTQPASPIITAAQPAVKGAAKPRKPKTIAQRPRRRG